MISYHTCPLASEEGKETGGMNVYVLELSKALVAQGHKVDMFTRCSHVSNPHIVIIQPNLRLIHVKAGPSENVPKKKLIVYIPEFANAMQQFSISENSHYDVYHCHYYLSGLIGLELNKGQSVRTPLIMSFHTLALMKNLVARDELEKEEIVRITAETLLTEQVDYMIVPSVSEMNYLEYLYHAIPSKITVIPPGVDTNLFKPGDKNMAKDKIGAQKDENIILFVGRIEPLKGLDMLLYAMKVLVVKHPEIKACLWIVGGDVSQKQEAWSKQLKMLQQIREVLGITTLVKFVGQKTQHELPDYYNASEMVVMPSHYESFGMVSLEAMACGVPVITTNVAGISQLIDKTHASLITSVNNPLLLETQIKYLLTDSKSHAQISQELLSKARELDWSKVVKKIIAVYG